MDIFFVLSGYLITQLLASEYATAGGVNVGRFLVRRGFKIYPPLWCLIAATVGMELVRSHPLAAKELARRTLVEFLFVQNYLRGLWTHTWSLAVEEHFYLAIALTAWLCASRQSLAALIWRYRTWLFFAAIALISAWRVKTACAVVQRDVTDSYALLATPLNADGLLVGSCMALSVTFGGGKVIQVIQSYRIVAVGVACFLLAPMFIFDFADDRYLLLVWALGKIAVWLAAALLVAAALTVVSVSNPVFGGIARIGRASYSIYLWHQAVNYLGARGILLAAGSSSWWLYFGVYVAGSICFGLLMHEILERPLLRLRDTWSRAR